MKTLFLCNLIPDKSGAFERLLMALGEGFRQAGDELILGLAGEPIPAVADSFRRAGLRWSVIPGWTDSRGRPRPWAVVRPALRLIRAERPAAVAFHFGNELPALAISLLAPSAGGGSIRWVWVQHQQMRDPVGVARWISRIRLLALTFKGFVATYEGGRTSLIRRGIPEGRIVVIRNAIPDYWPQREAGWFRREWGIAPGIPMAVTTGSLIPRKRIDFILRAVAGRESDLGLFLAVIGDGPARTRLEALASELGLSGRVAFLGQRSDVREILPEAAVYLHAAEAETGTYAIIEAMAAGLPVLATEAGAAREQVVEGETGYVLAPDDLTGYIDRLNRLVGDPALRRRMGESGRRRWSTAYRLEENWIQYRSLLGSRSAT